MERARAASGGDQVRAELPMETLENQVPGLEQPQAPAEEPPESPENSLAPAVHQATGAGQDFSGGKKLPSPHPARLRVLPPSLGYGAFRRQVSASPEPPSPGPAAAEQPRDREAELVPWAAPVELQVDVRVKPVGAAGGSRAPSPAPSTRFITVPVPESPGFSRHASPVFPILPRTASLGSTWGRGSQLAVARAEHGLDAEGRVDPAEGDAESPGSPKCRCRCKEQELEKEDTVLLHRAQVDGDLKLHRAIKLIELCDPCQPVLEYLHSLQKENALPLSSHRPAHSPRAADVHEVPALGPGGHGRAPGGVHGRHYSPGLSNRGQVPAVSPGLAVVRGALLPPLRRSSGLESQPGVLLSPQRHPRPAEPQPGLPEQMPSHQVLLGGGPERPPWLALD
ncbi:killer cell lectin-like receptor subfamily G member 2 isoform X2 [Artibeus jamaicensis]|uniref:killer cell lectin-like receptor subfamily G member 2 isoform X2 n=1 Tax=Artibeus jamaicensis TaxID=9417 RepID=UPI00235A691B|nr:killer cell lectin-like receptor subfamily G member 2 isoform X2 [Artibeus jamaicensis]